MLLCPGCPSPVACSGASLCLLDTTESLAAAKSLLAGQICGCQRENCNTVAHAIAQWRAANCHSENSK